MGSQCIIKCSNDLMQRVRFLFQPWLILSCFHLLLKDCCWFPAWYAQDVSVESDVPIRRKEHNLYLTHSQTHTWQTHKRSDLSSRTLCTPHPILNSTITSCHGNNLLFISFHHLFHFLFLLLYLFKPPRSLSPAITIPDNGDHCRYRQNSLMHF